MTPSVLTDREEEYQRISKDLPPDGTRVNKIFRQIEKSNETNLLDDLSSSLEKSAAYLLNDVDLLETNDLLMDEDNPLD